MVVETFLLKSRVNNLGNCTKGCHREITFLLPANLREGHVFSRVCLSSCTQWRAWGPHVTTNHNAFDLLQVTWDLPGPVPPSTTIQGPLISPPESTGKLVFAH